MAGRFDAIFGRDRISLFGGPFFILSRISPFIDRVSPYFNFAIPGELGYLMCAISPYKKEGACILVALLGAFSVLPLDRTIRRPLILDHRIFLLLYPIRELCRELLPSSPCTVQFLPDSKYNAICTFHYHDLDAQGHVPSPTTTHLMACIVSYKRAAYGCAESSDFETTARRRKSHISPLSLPSLNPDEISPKSAKSCSNSLLAGFLASFCVYCSESRSEGRIHCVEDVPREVWQPSLDEGHKPNRKVEPPNASQ